MTKHQPMECRTSCRNLHVASQISLNFNIKIKTYRFRINHYNSEEVERQLKYWDWKIRLHSVQDPASPTPMCFRCSQDPPGHTSSGYLCNAFHQEDLRQDGCQKRLPANQYSVKWIFGRNFFIGSCSSKIPRTVTPVLQYKWKQTCKIETFPNRHISVCLGGFRLSVTLWQTSDGQQATN